MKYLEVQKKAKKNEIEITDHNRDEIIKEIILHTLQQDIEIAENERNVIDVKENSYLLPAEADELQAKVKRKIMEVCGSKYSAAYEDKSIKAQVAIDIWNHVKRNFDIDSPDLKRRSYKNIRRKNFKTALALVDTYTLPLELGEKIEAMNTIEFY